MTRPGHPGDLTVRAADCRCAGTRAARYRGRTGRRAAGPPRAPWRCRSFALSSASCHAASYSSGVSSGVRPRSRNAWSAANSGLPPSMMSVPRPAMLVATVTAALRPAFGDDRRLARVLLGVEDLVRDAPAQQQDGQPLGLRHARRTDQDRLPRLVPLGDVVDDRGELRVLGLVDQVGLVGRGSSAGWSGSAPRRACRSGAARPLRSAPYRSCRTACRRAGSSSAA